MRIVSVSDLAVTSACTRISPGKVAGGEQIDGDEHLPMNDTLGMHVIERVDELSAIIPGALEREGSEAGYSRLEFAVLCKIEDVVCGLWRSIDSVQITGGRNISKLMST